MLVKVIKEKEYPHCRVCDSNNNPVNINFRDDEDTKDIYCLKLCGKHYNRLVDSIKITEHMKCK